MYDVIISHIREDLSSFQTNAEHSAGVADMASRFASTFGMANWGLMLGKLHDKGKERDSFQRYIRKVTGYDTTAKWHGEDKQHAFIGALLAKGLYPVFYPLLSMPIIGHHGGLNDFTDHNRRLTSQIPEEVDTSVEKLNLSIPQKMIERYKDRQTLARDYHHLVRMLFSCLVDADFLDTERFMSPESAASRGGYLPMSVLEGRLNEYLEQLKQNAADTPLNRLRTDIQNRCNELSSCSTGFYSLTVPTGGGKTLSSLLWAVRHAISTGKSRIIISIPYTSIISQTAQILGKIFGEENVLEHHSNFDPSTVNDERIRHKLKLATENWDYPIVITTNVQLFESMMSNKPSQCRKLHNIVDSVIILDEVQTLPLDHLQPIVDTLGAYNRMFNTSVLFTTASMPALRGDICWGSMGTNKLRGVQEITEIIPSEWKLHEKLRRTVLHIEDKEWTIEKLANELGRYSQVLCVINTRKEAKEVFEALQSNTVKKIHLSRMMCSAHLKKEIANVREMLRVGEPLIVISTQLIEAGVDIDFSVVYRQESGLDSILQAAGRCNREGLLEQGKVVVFKLDKTQRPAIQRAVNSWSDFDKEHVDWFSPETIEKYFVQRYSRHTNFDKADIAGLLYRPNEWCFESAAKSFSLIDSKGYVSIVVNYGDSAELINKLRYSGPSYTLMKRLSLYTVNVHRQDFEKLAESGMIEEVIEGIYYLSDKKQYSEDIGLIVDAHWAEELLII